MSRHNLMQQIFTVFVKTCICELWDITLFNLFVCSDFLFSLTKLFHNLITITKKKNNNYLLFFIMKHYSQGSLHMNKTMGNKLMYILNDDTQSYQYCGLQFMVETFYT